VSDDDSDDLCGSHDDGMTIDDMDPDRFTRGFSAHDGGTSMVARLLLPPLDPGRGDRVGRVKCKCCDDGIVVVLARPSGSKEGPGDGKEHRRRSF
jgi:hypothetical protein